MNSSKKREFLELITIGEAQEIILRNLSWEPSSEIINLNQALGRSLASDIIAKIDNPPFDRSRMDGFALRAKDTFDIDETNPKTFQIIDSIPAGKTSLKVISEPFTCIEIATGAPIPLGANAVQMVEYSSKSGNYVQIYRAVTPYENIDAAGSDIMFGETILHKGDILTPTRLGILAALGENRVKVYSKLRVGVLSSGDELRLPGSKLSPGNLYDSNSVVLISLLKEIGVEAIPIGISPDDINILKKIISENLEEVDILLISGGTSAGEGDYSYRVIEELGGELLFHGVSMKPGKPLAAGKIENKLVITLPGFPASAIFSFNAVITPLLRKWIKKPSYSEKSLKAKLNQKIRSSSGRSQFKLVHIIQTDEEYRIFPVKGTSGSISMLERADGFIVIPDNVEFLNPGSILEVKLLRERLYLPDIVFIGSHDLVLDRLFEAYRSKYPTSIVKQIYTGSTGGLSAIGKGECDIAGIHLFDEKAKQYNSPFIVEWQLNDKVTLIKGYTRKQGFYVQKGNPKRIMGLNDLLNSKITIMNRNEGSGTRILLDSLLKNMISLVDAEKLISGYSSVSYSHSAAANSVAHKKVDVSIGIEPYARLIGTDFIPIADEEYDLLIANKSLNKTPIKRLLNIFNSESFRSKIEIEIPNIRWRRS